MKYQCYHLTFTLEQRKTWNRKVAELVKNREKPCTDLSAEQIYNVYTGVGGLHNLKREDFDNYSEYSSAKKEAENGQFFTPPEYCQYIIESLGLTQQDLVADMACGKGNFFNFCPNEGNVYGCELDLETYQVAHYLYPKAHLKNQDIQEYEPKEHFDCVIGNPPFHLKWELDGEEMPSQLYYCLKAWEQLVPLGILAVIVPCSFLTDPFTDQKAIRKMEERYSFLCQVALPEEAFEALGVRKFATKVQFWQKRSKRVREIAYPYREEMAQRLNKYSDLEREADALYAQYICMARECQMRNQAGISLEVAAKRDPFQYQLLKYLYQIKIHPVTRRRYPECMGMLREFREQKRPEGMDYKTWEQTKMKRQDVLLYLKKVLQSQNISKVRKCTALVKRDYGLAVKDYTAGERTEYFPFYDLVVNPQLEKFPQYGRLLRKKRREYEKQSLPFCAMEENDEIGEWLRRFTLFDRERLEWIKLNQIQRRDINLLLQKRYGMLQWEQGSGKTLAGIAIGMFRMENQKLHSTWVVSSAISIRNNWQVVLVNYGLPFVFIHGLRDLRTIQRGYFVLMTLSGVVKYQKQIQQWMRRNRKKVQLILDESDEISNPDSLRTKAVLACFRRCWAKTLTTGTSTRNNIQEFVPQLELMYNNSVNMLSLCPKLYHYKKKDNSLNEEDNTYYGMPIPAYKEGYRLFAASHLPCKITVFGLEQKTQDIYQADVLKALLDKTVITRTFEEVSGKDIKHIYQYPIRFAPDEKSVYEKALQEFHTMRSYYFQSTGNDRKDGMMKLVQQMILLLRISAAPDAVKEYQGETPVKIMTVVELVAEWKDQIVAIGVRHKSVLQSYAKALKSYLPERELFLVTGEMSFYKRRELKKILQGSGNGILLCTQQSLPSSVNLEFVNKVIIPELHYNNSQMSQFYFRFIRYISQEEKEIYFITYLGSLESNLMQMILAKEKLNLFMKGEETDLDSIYERFGVNYDLMSTLMQREEDEHGNLCIRWGKQEIV